MTDVRTLLAKNMKHYRKILGISQMTLAARVGCSTTMIANIEIKKSFPSAENINRIAETLEIKPADLFAESTEGIIPASVFMLEFKKKTLASLEAKILAVFKEQLAESKDSKKRDEEF
ncbi:MAG: helix-turn-helix domain-containing protein [Spirochaetaceae bacterium]|nr:helix-turn-helix domain-containing protein [Spirochaetaceae bacterium]